MIERCKSCGKFSTSENYKNFDLVNDLQWLKAIAKVKQQKELDPKKEETVREKPNASNVENR